MLQNIRDNLTGPIMWFVIAIIVGPFAFFGIEQFRTGGSDPTMAKVGDARITHSQYQARYDQQVQQLQQYLGENFQAEQITTPQFKRAVLDNMIQEQVLRQHVQDAGYRASDAEVFKAISVIPAFQENGKFSSEAYRSRLSQVGQTTTHFEQTVRDSLVIDQMRDGILESSFVTDAGAEGAWRLDDQQRWLAYVVFEPSKYQAAVKVEPDQVQKRYDQRKAQYMSPERVKVAYVELSLDSLKPADAPAADVLKVIYEAEKGTRFSTPEERHARHILVNFGADKAAAKKKAEAIAEKVRAGADFGSVAAAESSDPGSKNKGGDLGLVKRGQMLQKFEEALFAMKPGELSPPVETEFGWHLIKLDDVREARVRPFEDPGVQQELLTLYRNRDAQRRFQEQSEKLEQVAFESPSSLEPAAKALGVEIKTTDWFTKAGGGEGLAANKTVVDAAFSEDVLQNGENSRPLKAGDNKLVVIRKADHEAPRQRPLEEVAEQIRNELKLEAARAKAQADAEAVLAALKQGKSLEQAARGVAIKNPGAVKRGASGVEPAVMDALFRLQRPETGKASWGQARLPNGDIAVLGTLAIQDGQWNLATEADKKKATAKAREAEAGAELAAYRKDVEGQIAVKVIAPPEGEPAS
jgi:peptidyl-prolyl cis-trans isomerase D